MAPGEVYFFVLGVSLSLPFHRCFRLIFIYIFLLPEGKNGYRVMLSGQTYRRGVKHTPPFITEKEYRAVG
jgi:hypothetical protein